jgi:putative endonuclease
LTRLIEYDETWVKTYWVYIMTTRSGTLYAGVTSDLARRVYEHRNRLVSSFTSRYNIDRLVHAESFAEARDAIAREKQIKGWVRSRKLALITDTNPHWRDLGEEWFGPVDE